MTNIFFILEKDLDMCYFISNIFTLIVTDNMETTHTKKKKKKLHHVNNLYKYNNFILFLYINYQNWYLLTLI